jgi:hypothetical protein
MSSILKRSFVPSLAMMAMGLAVLVPALVRADTGDALGGPQIIDRYLAATQAAQTSMLGKSMQVEISATLPKLNKQGKLSALRRVSQVGRVTYRMLGFSGDTTVKKDVIARYLSAEVQASGNGSDLGITPANYKFKFKGLQNRDGKDVYVFQLAPRKKEVGLFKGDLWIDPHTFMPVREAGKFVKNPSIFFKRTDFVRTYNIQNGVAVPQHIDSVIKTRIVGPVEISINFNKPAPLDEAEADAAEGGDGATQ